MSVEIQPVRGRRDLRRFIRFHRTLYKGSPYAVPELAADMFTTFSRSKNAACEFCDMELYLAYRNKEVVGRVAAVVNRRANEHWGQSDVRFGWIDFIDDEEVSAALLEAVKDFGRRHGMNRIVGPMGFCDMDPEGMLVEGFEELSTMSTLYNYPYYPRHMERFGYEKAADWVEKKIYVPDEMPEKPLRVAEIVKRKYGLRIKKIEKKRGVIKSGLAREVFRLINEAYSPLFGYCRMTERQISQYVRTYVPLLDLRMVTLVENSAGELVGVGISMPSLSRALQKSGGCLFPMGWWHLLKALWWKHDTILDLLLVAVRPDYQGKGVNALLFTDLIPVYQQMGFRYAESNPELEANHNIQNQWQYFHVEQHKRRRCFSKSL